MKSIAHRGSILCLLIIALAATSQAADMPSVINLMVDMDLPASPTTDQLSEAEMNFIPIYNALSTEPKVLNWTIFLVQDASVGKRLYFAQLALRPQIELAMSGNHSDEKLSSKSYEEQKAILERSKQILMALKVCGVNEVPANGFIPQSFDQNEDTYKALDDLGIDYDAGFQAGIIYAPGHENDVWPYKVENHKFYAVPVSTTTLSGEKVPLDDRFIKNKGISASQWYDLLAGKLDKISGMDEPMVISLSTSISGKGDYLDALKKFLDYAESKEAKFVNTIDIVNMARSGIHEVAAVSLEEPSSSEQENASSCPTCDSSVKVTNESIFV